MQDDRLRQAINVVATIAVIVVNTLANALPINNLTQAEISDRFDVLFVPAGYAFSIWGLIYLGLIGFTLYQALPSQRTNPLLRRIGYLYAISALANIGWIFLWHYERFPLSLIAMLVLLVSLIAIYLRLSTGRTRVPPTDNWLVRVPFSIYLGWITVATVANVTIVLDFVGWDGLGVAPEGWAIVMLIAGTAIASAMSLTRGDVPYMLVIVWAFIGIAIEQAGTPAVAVTAWVLSAVVAVVAVIGALQQRRRDLPMATSG